MDGRNPRTEWRGGRCAKIARQIVILLDGAATTMLIHRDPAYVELAGEVAAELIERSRPSKPGLNRFLLPNGDRTMWHSKNAKASRRANVGGRTHFA